MGVGVIVKVSLVYHIQSCSGCPSTVLVYQFIPLIEQVLGQLHIRVNNSVGEVNSRYN
jgi:hypothetical protein